MSTPQTAHVARKENHLEELESTFESGHTSYLPTVCATALAVAFAVSLPATLAKLHRHPCRTTSGRGGTHAFLVGHAFGTQNYVCVPSANGVAYVLFTPAATLVNDDGDQLITHFFSPNPDPSDPNITTAVVADGAIRATWQSKDGSSVWAALHVNDKGVKALYPRQDCRCLAPARQGWSRKRTHRWQHPVEDHPGPAPEHHWRSPTGAGHGCDLPSDVGHTAFSDYTADYFFYTDE